MASRKLFVDESIFEGINIQDEIMINVERVSTVSKKNLKSRKSNTPKKSNKKSISKKSPKEGIKQKLEVSFELVRDEPVPMFRMTWNSKAINFGDTFSKIYGRQIYGDYIDFPLKRLEEVKKGLKNFSNQKNTKLKTIPLPKYVLKSFETTRFSADKQIKNSEKMAEILSILPKTIRDALHPFQRQSLLFADEKDGRLLIGDEMGLGKTIQAIAVCALYRQDWPVLVIAPSSLKDNWHFELLRWLPEHLDESKIRIISTFKTAEALKEADFYIVSYNIASKNAETLSQLKYNTVILDECHMLKSDSAKRSKRISPLARLAKRRILLSGTATPSRPIELYTQLQCLLPPGETSKTWFMSRNGFSTRYCNGHRELKGRVMVWDEKGSSHLTELNLMLRREAMIRRLKKDALPNLQPKVRKTYRVEQALSSSPELLAAYSKFDQRKIANIFDGFYERTLNNGPDNPAPKLAFSSDTKKRDFMQLYQNTGLAKVKAVCAFLARKVERGRKTIVFAHHKAVLDVFEEFLMRRECGFIRIDGRVAVSKRFEMVKQFQRFDYCQVALLSISATGVGITLTSAERVIFAELDFVPAKLLQCEDRAHRMGQKKLVKIYYILAKKTLDDFVWPLIQRKLQTTSTTLDGRKIASLKISSTTKFEGGALIKEKNLDAKVKLRQTEITF